jgi:hypothetical protein
LSFDSVRTGPSELVHDDVHENSEIHVAPNTFADELARIAEATELAKEEAEAALEREWATATTSSISKKEMKKHKKNKKTHARESPVPLVEEPEFSF